MIKPMFKPVIKVFLYSLFLFVFSNSALAGQYGLVRVQVQAVNSAHKTPAAINVNGAPLLNVSHADSNQIIQPLEERHLARGRGSSSLTSDYTGLEKGCEFDFTISYAMGPNSSWISLGTPFRAPTTNVSVQIPIGICSDGKVCSSNPSIQAQIEEVRRKEEIAKRNQDYARIRKEVAERRQKISDRFIQLAREAKSRSATVPEEKTDTSEAKELADELAADSKKREFRPVLDDVNAADSDPVEIEMRDQQQALAREQSRLVENQLRQAGVDDTTIAVSLHEGITYYLDTSNRQWSAECTGGGGYTPSQCGELSIFMVGLNLKKQKLDHLGDILQTTADVIKNGAAIGVRFVPGVNDVLDVCEATTGREYCVQQGRKLETWERGLAVVGIVAGSGKIYRDLTKKVLHIADGLKVSEEAAAALKAGDKILDSTKNVAPRLGNKYVKELPDLIGTTKEAFEGHIFKGTYEPGEILTQVQRTGQTIPGNWFGPVKPINAEHAEALFNIKKWGNDAGQIKVYKIKERVSGYAGKVAGGDGHQFLVPRDVPIEDVIEEITF